MILPADSTSSHYLVGSIPQRLEIKEATVRYSDVTIGFSLKKHSLSEKNINNEKDGMHKKFLPTETF